MDQVLSLKQTTILAPQLQQGVHLLNLSSIDLQTEVDTALETNPFLEKLELDADFSADSLGADPRIPDTKKAPHPHQSAATSFIHGAAPAASQPTPGQVNSTAGRRSSSQGDSAMESAFQISTEMTLHTYLHQQAQSTPLSDKQHHILELLVDSVNDNGYLRARSTDIVELAMPEYVVKKAEVFEMIRVLQDFEPVGVGARSASECLLMQLREKADDIPGLSLARQIIKDYLPMLAKQKITDIAAALGLDESALATPIALIKTLNPFPGASIASRVETYVTPDLILKKL
ncbi:MAG: hypothetical protein KAG66_13725, partial [Methylococcales bacterium]|nr:hypothetical protein [Methylococcales bacterium]